MGNSSHHHLESDLLPLPLESGLLPLPPRYEMEGNHLQISNGVVTFLDAVVVVVDHIPSYYFSHQMEKVIFDVVDSLVSGRVVDTPVLVVNALDPLTWVNYFSLVLENASVPSLPVLQTYQNCDFGSDCARGSSFYCGSCLADSPVHP